MSAELRLRDGIAGLLVDNGYAETVGEGRRMADMLVALVRPIRVVFRPECICYGPGIDSRCRAHEFQALRDLDEETCAATGYFNCCDAHTQPSEPVS